MAYLRNNSQAQAYAANFASYLDIANEPQYYGKLIKQFGKGLYLFDFLHMAGKTMSIANPTLNLIEEGAPERPVTCSIAITAAPLDVDITFASSDNSDDYVREGFDLLIPPAYTNKNEVAALRIYLDGSQWKGQAYDPTLAITAAITNKEFIFGASSWGYGTGQPAPVATGLYSRTYRDRIIKDTSGIEGGQLARMDWKPVSEGSGTLMSRQMVEMEFRFNAQMDRAILVGESNANSSLTQESQIVRGSNNQIPSTEGVIQAMRNRGQAQSYTTDYGADQFDAVKPLLEGQGIVSDTVKLCSGTDLFSLIENDILEWLQTNSAVVPLYDGMDKAGFSVRQFEKNSYIFDIFKTVSFSNPNALGASEYPYGDYGLMFPDNQVMVKDTYGLLNQQTERGVEASRGGNRHGAGDKVKMNHLTLGYINNNGENRTRILTDNFGVNGMGYSTNNPNDGGFYYLLSHFMNILVNMNQTVLVTK